MDIFYTLLHVTTLSVPVYVHFFVNYFVVIQVPLYKVSYYI